MNNAQFKIECFRNGLYSPEQVIDFYNVIYEDNKKFNKRDAQLWMNGKSFQIYIIDHTAIDMINMLNRVRSEILVEEKERISKGKRRYEKLFKSTQDLWNVHKELIDLPLNFYNSILVELGSENLDYYENISVLEDKKNEH